MRNSKNSNTVLDNDDEADDTSRWLLPYADFITLLFAVFVVMYSVSNVEESKFKSLSDSLSIALNVKNAENKNIIFDSQKTNSLIDLSLNKEDRLLEIGQQLQNDLAPLVADKKIKIIKIKEGITIIINDSLLFKSGQAQIDPNFDMDLRQISDVLKNIPI